MERLSFRKFFEATDIFGFEPERSHDEPDDNMLSHPIKRFNIETMMDILSEKSLANQKPHMPFSNIIQWGNQTGALRLEIDTGMTFHLRRLGSDKEGSPRWITKRLFQLNRQGYGGQEDKVAQEVFEYMENLSDENIDAPVKDYDSRDFQNLVSHIFNKVKRTAKIIFLPEGIRKLHDDCFIIRFAVRGHGLEEANRRRVEENQTMITFDRAAGSIRVTNYNLTSPVGKAHEWSIGTNDLDCYFFPTQSRDEISEIVSVHMKYY